MNLIIYFAVGYSIGAIIGYFQNKYVDSPDYGIDGKKEVDNYMSNNYGQNWNEM